jgi:succinoglycan biosynthesis protein ExoM
MVRADLRSDRPDPFDGAHGPTGGEDGELLDRLVQQGARIVWCDEAVLTEPVEAARLRLRWLLLRALRGGQDDARHRIRGRPGGGGALRPLGRLSFIGRAAVQAGAAALLVPLIWPAGRHRAVQWAVKAATQVGKLSAFAAWHGRDVGPAGREGRGEDRGADRVVAGRVATPGGGASS